MVMPASHNKVPKAGEDIECEIPLESFPSPGELWQRYKTFRNIETSEESLVVEPYQVDGSGKEPGFYPDTTDG